MTLLTYILLSIIAALAIGFAVLVFEYRELRRKYEKLQSRCWGLQHEVMENGVENVNSEAPLERERRLVH